MPDFNSNEMDALFREGAERHEFEYNSDAWALMEEKLDKRDSKRRFLYYFLGFLIISTIIGSIVYNTNKQSEAQDIASTSTLQHSNNSNTNKADKNIEAEHALETVSTSESTSPQSESETAAFSSNNQKETKTYISTDSKESRSNIGAQNSFQNEDTGNLIGNEIVSMPSQIETEESHSKINEVPQSENVVAGIKDFSPSTNRLVNTSLSFASLAQRDFELFDLAQRDLEPRSILNYNPLNNTALVTSSNRFAFTVFANPEWSSVGVFQDLKAGWSVGTKIGYQFADKFEVSAGVAFSRKIYKGTGTEYTMEGGWFEDIEPMSMDAKCDVIEIPLAISYYANGYKNSGFFTDLGVSSYMLHSEWYGFAYDDALIRPAEYIDVNENNENKHLVGVGRFAIGYQKVLSNNTAFQLSPYIQFPLTGIGAGKVNLYSSGVQFAVKFNTQ